MIAKIQSWYSKKNNNCCDRRGDDSLGGRPERAPGVTGHRRWPAGARAPRVAAGHLTVGARTRWCVSTWAISEVFGECFLLVLWLDRSFSFCLSCRIEFATVAEYFRFYNLGCYLAASRALSRWIWLPCPVARAGGPVSGAFPRRDCCRGARKSAERVGSDGALPVLILSGLKGYLLVRYCVFIFFALFCSIPFVSYWASVIYCSWCDNAIYASLCW